jgi:Spy/CpxP family protein refolding chaperone
MKLNRARFLILVLLLALPILPAAGAAFQGEGYGRPDRTGAVSPEQQLKRMSKEFNLTADQQSKVKPILVDQRKKMDSVRDDSSLDRSAMRDKMMQIRKDTNGQIRALLDDKQKEKWDKLQQEREERMQNRRGGESGEPGGADSGSNPPTPAPPQN